MILIFEGPDKAGKSTIIDRIPGIKIKNGYWPKDGSIEEVQKVKDAYSIIMMFLKQYDNSKYNIIWDRSFLSELVYSKPRRGYEAMDDSFWYRMRNELHKLDYIVFYFDASNETLWKRCVKDKDPDATKKEIDEIKFRYHRVLNDYKFAHRVINTDKLSVDECVKDIEYVVDRLDGKLWK